MAVAFGGDEEFYYGEVGRIGVLVPALQGSPAKDVKGQIGVRLGSQCCVHVSGSEAGFKLLDPCFELGLERGSGSGTKKG